MRRPHNFGLDAGIALPDKEELGARFERVTFAFGGQTPTTTLSSTDEQRFPDAASQEESLISIEAIVNVFMFLYGQLVIEVDVQRSREKW
ncbi:hypothetical protein A6X20_12615 [Bradyrhizobium elkanii]|nr:hypothetical protein A6X20_12615 [Bradyrhizobium elkanii]